MNTVQDVLDFIEVADECDLETIAEELQNRNVDFYCSECEDRDDSCDCNDEDDEYLRNEFIKELIAKANQFGITDMLDDLKREGERIGVFLKAGVQINA